MTSKGLPKRRIAYGFFQRGGRKKRSAGKYPDFKMKEVIGLDGVPHGNNATDLPLV